MVSLIVLLVIKMFISIVLSQISCYNSSFGYFFCIIYIKSHYSHTFTSKSLTKFKVSNLVRFAFLSKMQILPKKQTNQGQKIHQ